MNLKLQLGSIYDMKIFQIGFNRCGTTSIYNFFNKCENKKLKCLHWEKGERGFGFKDVY